MQLAERVACITGAARGIGAATARLFSEHGAKLALIDVNLEAAQTLAASLRASQKTAEAFACDVRSPEAIQSTIRAVLERYGQIDILINNAGITRDKSALNLTEASWREVIDVNLSGSFYMAQCVGSHMKARGFGRIVNAMSTSAWGKFGQANYAASKAGLRGLTRTLALEWAKHGITVNAVAPGYIDTEMTAAMPEAARRESVGKIPVGRIGQVDDIARAYLFLASPAASFITGQVIVVDGGRSLV